MASTSAAVRELEFGQGGEQDESSEVESTGGFEADERITRNTVSKSRLENQYIDNQMASSDLHLHNPSKCKEEFLDSGPLGLFFLFIPKRFIDRYMFKATKELLESKESGQKTNFVLTNKAFRCVIGLDIAMSLCNNTAMKELWSTKMFMGSSSFASTMSRDNFVRVRGSLQIYSQTMAKNTDDPLWVARTLMTHVLRHFTSVAQIVGPIALDEASCATKARTKASTYIPSKPDKLAIRFYAVVGWKYPYTFGLWDNGAGNAVNQTAAERYLKVFGELMPSFNQLCQAGKSRLRNACPIAVDTASMLWVLMLGLLYRTLITANAVRPRESVPKTNVYMDNFYTRYSLGKAISDYTDGNTKITGTVRLNLIDKVNKGNVSKAVKEVDNQERGCWMLMKAYSAAIHPDKKTQAAKEKEKEYSKSLIRMKVGFELKDITLMEKEYAVADKNSGYIVYKDKKVVVFYTKDLKELPPKPSCIMMKKRQWKLYMDWQQCIAGSETYFTVVKHFKPQHLWSLTTSL